MVTTRGKAKAAAQEEITTPSAQILASTRKRQRQTVIIAASEESSEVVEPASGAKKRKVTAPSVRTMELHNRIEVKIPITPKHVIDLESGGEEEPETPVAPLQKKRQSCTKVERKETAKPPMMEISLLSDDEEELEEACAAENRVRTNAEKEGDEQKTKERQLEEKKEKPKVAALSGAISLLSDDEEGSKPEEDSHQVQSDGEDEGIILLPRSQKGQSLPTEPVVGQSNSSSREEASKVARSKSPNMNTQAKTSGTVKEVEIPKDTPKAKHRRFGSEEPVFEIPSSDPQDNDNIGEESEDSDDDAPPEEVGNREAEEDAKKNARAANQAVQQQKAAKRKSQRERALAMKKQAELNKKRMRQSGAEDARQEDEDDRVEGPIEDGHHEQTEIEDVAMEDAPSTPAPSGASSKKSQKIDPSELPELLPLEYLEEDSVAESTTITTTSSIPTRPRKTKFPNVVEQKLKDKKKGSTTFKVRESKQDSRLAPKASKSAMSLKEAWLNGGTKKNGKAGTRRMPMKSSFLVNGKSGAGKR